MDFIEKAEELFKNLQYPTAIDPALNFKFEGKEYSVELPYHKIEPRDEIPDMGPINFSYEREFLKLKFSFKKEPISAEEAINLFEHLKDDYWMQPGHMDMINFTPLVPTDESYLYRKYKNRIYEKVLFTDFIIDEMVKTINGTDEPFIGSPSRAIKLHFQVTEQYVKKRKKIYEELLVLFQNKSVAKNFDNLPDPYEIASKFYNQKTNKRKEYKPDEIALVMDKTRQFIIQNEITDTLWGEVLGIHLECKKLGYKGGKTAHYDWIKFYAKEVGLKER